MSNAPTDFNDQAALLGKAHLAEHVRAALAAIEADKQAPMQSPPEAFAGYEDNPSIVEDEPPEDGQWVRRLEKNQYGHYKPGLRNTALVLRHDRHWSGALGFCEFSYRLIKRKPLPIKHSRPGELNDFDAAAIRDWMAATYGFTPSGADLNDAFMVVAQEHRFHPVRDWLESLRWDGVSRLSTWLQQALGAQDDEAYLSIVGPKFLIGSVARIFEPGCKMDNVLILEGEQGRGKSTSIDVLFGDWYTDAPIPIGDKDAYQVIQGKWCLELAELDAFHKTEVTALKHFFSQRIDRYRASYGRMAADYPRQTVFSGTTNQEAYLRDYSGNRRFWPVYCTIIDLQWLRGHRDQLWAEAAERYRGGVQWWVADDEKAVVEDAQDARLQRDPWEDILRDFLHAVTRPHLSSAEVLKEGLGFDNAHIQQAHMNRLAPIMKALGWKSKRVRVADESGVKSQKRVWVNPRITQVPL